MSEDLRLPLNRQETRRLSDLVFAAGFDGDAAQLQAWLVQALFRGAVAIVAETEHGVARLAIVETVRETPEEGRVRPVPQQEIPRQPTPQERQQAVRNRHELVAAELPELQIAERMSQQFAASRIASEDDVMDMVERRREARGIDADRGQSKRDMVERRLAEMTQATDSILDRLRRGGVQFPAYRHTPTIMPGVSPVMTIPGNCDSGRGGRTIQFGHLHSLSVQAGYVGEIHGVSQFAWICQVTDAGRMVQDLQRQCGSERDLKRWFADVVSRYEYVPASPLMVPRNPNYRGTHDLAVAAEPTTSLTGRERVIELLGD